jgi:hypothetical protein
VADLVEQTGLHDSVILVRDQSVDECATDSTWVGGCSDSATLSVISRFLAKLAPHGLSVQIGLFAASDGGVAKSCTV